MRSLMMKKEIVTTSSTNISDDSFNVTFEKYHVVTSGIISINGYKSTFTVICPTIRSETAIADTATCAMASARTTTIFMSFNILIEILYCLKKKNRRGHKNKWRKKRKAKKKMKEKRNMKGKKLFAYNWNGNQFSPNCSFWFTWIQVERQAGNFFEIYYPFFHDHSYVPPYFSIQFLQVKLQIHFFCLWKSGI